MGDLQSPIAKVAPEIIALFGSINPILGAVVAVALASVLGYIGWRSAKSQKVVDAETTNGKVVDETSKGQTVSDNVQDKLDDFLNKG